MFSHCLLLSIFLSVSRPHASASASAVDRVRSASSAAGSFQAASRSANSAREAVVRQAAAQFGGAGQAFEVEREVLARLADAGALAFVRGHQA